MELPPEQPLYSVYASKKRALIPKTLYLIILAIIFYLGVLVNIFLLQLDAQQETTLKTGSLIILTILIVIGILLEVKKTHQPYVFYRNRITRGKEILYYLNITNTQPQINLFDKMFETYSVPLGKKFSIRHIPQSIPLSNYIQQLLEYARRNQSVSQ